MVSSPTRATSVLQPSMSSRGIMVLFSATKQPQTLVFLIYTSTGPRTHLSQDQLCAKYPSLFQGIGKLKSVQVKLHIDPTVKPVAQPARRIPFHVRQKVEEELDGMEQKGIIERVYGPTPWVSPLVITPKKNGEVRVCVDMRMANRAIIRERHPMPTVDDLIHSLNGATVFSKLDL